MSLGISSMAMAHGGGGGGHFGGGGFGGGHFGGGHFSGGHFAGGHFFGGHRHFFVSGYGYGYGYWPYYGDSGYSDYSGSYDSTPYYGDSDSVVSTVQKALARAGYYHGPIDGALDLITQDAIARYDRDHHLPVSHAIGQPLLNALGVD